MTLAEVASWGLLGQGRGGQTKPSKQASEQKCSGLRGHGLGKQFSYLLLTDQQQTPL